MFTRAAVPLLATAVVLAGCGGATKVEATRQQSTASRPVAPTIAEYRTRAGAICRAYHSRMGHYASNSLTGLALDAQHDAAVLPAVQRQEEAIPVPAGYAHIVSALRAALRVHDKQIERLPGIIAREGLAGVTGAEATMSTTAGEVLALDRQLGIHDACTQ